MEHISIHRIVKGEYLPRRATVSGGTFEEMKETVKALPGARYEGGIKSWHVRGLESINHLKAQGWTVAPHPLLMVDVRTSVEIAMQRLEQRSDGSFLLLAYWTAMTPRGGFHTASLLYYPLRLSVGEETVGQVIRHIAAERQELDPSLALGEPSPRQAMWRICSAVLKTDEPRMQAVFRDAYVEGGRTEAAYNAAGKAVESAADTTVSYQVRWDETIVAQIAGSL